MRDTPVLGKAQHPEVAVVLLIRRPVVDVDAYDRSPAVDSLDVRGHREGLAGIVEPELAYRRQADLRRLTRRRPVAGALGEKPGDSVEKETLLITLETDRTVADFEQDDTGVDVILQSGERIRGRALVGCDGMWSKVRDKIVGDGKPLVSGHIAYRAVLTREEVPEDLWRPDVILWAGPRTHLVHYPLRRGEIYNLVAVFHSKRYVEGWNAEADASELWAHFKGQRPEVLRMLERIETWRMWVLCDREPVKEWSKGRVTLLGDAAHPMLQYLAQGACMATEDAVWLADKIAENPEDLPAAFRAYVQQRYLRTARVQIMARVYGDFYHARGPAAELRNQMLGPRSPEESYDGMAWLYGGM